MDLIVPIIVYSLVGVFGVVLAVRSVPENEQPWLEKTLALACALRLGLAVLFQVIPQIRYFHEDSDGYELVATVVARSWSGTVPPMDLSPTNSGYYYLGGALNYVFGLSRLHLPMLNALLGTGTVFLIYRWVRKLVHPRVARMAAMLVAFTPSMILWSSIAQKDALTTFLVVVAVSSCIRLKEGFTLRACLGIVIPLVLIQPVRFYLIYFVGIAALGSLIIDRGEKMVTGLYKQLLAGGAVVALFVVTGLSGRVVQETEFLDLQKVSAFRTGLASSARSGFAHDVDISTPGKALAFLPLGMSNLLFGPFPWQLTSPRALFALPETVFWWMLVPGTIRGALFLARRRITAVSPVLIFAATIICAYSLMHGSMGSAFRQRSQVFVFLFSFSAVGYYQKKCRQAGIDENALLWQPQRAGV